MGGLFPGIQIYENRKFHRDMIFLTNIQQFAEGYALRAAMKFGGTPIIIESLIGGERTVEIERSGRVDQYIVTDVPISCFREIKEYEFESWEQMRDRMVNIFKLGN